MKVSPTIVLTGGGSGGHITPILAVATELKRLRPDVRLVYVGQTGGSLTDIPAEHPAIDAVYGVQAGKFRRYHGEGWRQAFDLPTQANNVRDACRVLIGLWQSYRLLGKLRPAVVFTRGGYVSVPVALAAKLRSIPYVTHDADSMPSLANRIIARWASLHAVALPSEFYPYPRAKTRMVGTPVSGEYRPVSTKLQQSYRRELGLDKYEQVLLITGGGNGADELNKIVAHSMPALLASFSKLAVVHIAGRALEAGLNDQYDRLLNANDRTRVVVKGFVTDLYRYSGAADIIIARGGATGLAEFAVQGKACLIIPAKQLVWQMHHAKSLASHHAIAVLAEADAAAPGHLAEVVSELLSRPEQREALRGNLSKLSRPDAAKQLAMLLLDQIS